jgi:hypothetical protein
MFNLRWVGKLIYLSRLNWDEVIGLVTVSQMSWAEVRVVLWDDML